MEFPFKYTKKHNLAPRDRARADNAGFWPRRSSATTIQQPALWEHGSMPEEASALNIKELHTKEQKTRRNRSPSWPCARCHQKLPPPSKFLRIGNHQSPQKPATRTQAYHLLLCRNGHSFLLAIVPSFYIIAAGCRCISEAGGPKLGMSWR